MQVGPVLSANETRRRSSGRLLVVEDERIVARDLTNTLTDIGYTVVGSVATAEEAVQKAREHRPNLVLMDIRLAGPIDGVQAAATIRSERDIPVIYLTAHSDDETLRRATHTAPFGYLLKPFNAAELHCAIEIALHKHEIDARLRDREQWLTTTLRSIGDGVITTDPAQRITLLNPVAEALTGWKQEEAVGQALGDVMKLVTQQGGLAVENPVVRALQKKTVTTLQEGALLVNRVGSALPVGDSAAPITGGRGEVLGGVIVFRDISDQRQKEEEIRHLNTDLERRVRERTQQLEAANKELEAFSYSVAHDLRGPLRGIDGFSQALLEDHSASLGPEGLAHLGRVRTSARRMSQLIDDLLRLSRVAQSEFHPQSVDLSNLARLVASELQVTHADRNVVFTIQDGLTAQGDDKLLSIMLQNLFGNAWKFTAKTAQPEMEFGAFDKDGDQGYFVRDNGAGFSMAYAHKLFGAFQRLHAATEFEGTGVGLAIVQRVVNRHGGRIWAESAVGQGATFFFTLPDRC
jgi:PAS domain S-box-containing protein